MKWEFHSVMQKKHPKVLLLRLQARRTGRCTNPLMRYVDNSAGMRRTKRSFSSEHLGTVRPNWLDVQQQKKLEEKRR
jgi:hypothetical protein